MSAAETVLHRPPDRPAAPVPGRPRAAGSMGWLVAACLVVAALTLLLPSAPTYDPWSWLIWGRELTEFELNTRFGPSWKPLPVLFTTPFSLAGDAAAPMLWLVVARAGALLALVLAYRLARRLAGARFGALAGAVAALALVTSSGWVRNGALGNSEGLLVALVLWAVERHLDGRHAHAFALGALAGLLRPEVWPFLAAYGLWLWLREPDRRPLIAAAALVLAILWFVPEWIGSGDPLRASDRANQPNEDSPAFAARPALEVVWLAAGLVMAPVIAAALAAAALARSGPPRQRRVTLGLGAGALAWVGLVAAMTEAGYSGNARYLIPGMALVCVLAGVGAARLMALGERLAGGRLGRRSRPAGAVLAGALMLALSLPFLVARGEQVGDELRTADRHRALQDDLERAVERAGGRDEILACGTPVIGPLQVPMLVWHLHSHFEDVAYVAHDPGVVFRPLVPRPDLLLPTLAGEPRFEPLARVGRWQVLTAC